MVLRAVQLFKRDPGRAWLLTRMAWWILVVSVLARALSLPRALRFVSNGVRLKRDQEHFDLARLSTAVDALLETNFLVFKPSCWKRAAVLRRYFGLQGIATTIVFGLKREGDGELKGHAWLEAEGRPIGESNVSAYKVTYMFPATESLAR